MEGKELMDLSNVTIEKLEEELKRRKEALKRQEEEVYIFIIPKDINLKLNYNRDTGQEGGTYSLEEFHKLCSSKTHFLTEVGIVSRLLKRGKFNSSSLEKTCDTCWYYGKGEVGVFCEDSHKGVCERHKFQVDQE